MRDLLVFRSDLIHIYILIRHSVFQIKKTFECTEFFFAYLRKPAMCIQKRQLSKSIEIFSMYSPKEKSSSIDEQNTCLDADSGTRSYALIETDPNELDHIIDLLRQFFPKTKILEYNNHNQSTNSQRSSNANSLVRKANRKYGAGEKCVASLF